MNDLSRVRLDDDLTSSPIYFLAALLVVPVLTSIMAWNLPEPELMLNLALGLFVAIALLWLTARRWPWLTKIGTIALMLGLGVVLRFGLQQSAGLVCVVVAVAIAGAIAPGLAPIVTATLATLLVPVLPGLFGVTPSYDEVGLMLVSVWLTALAVSVQSRPIRMLARWSLEHYEQAQGHLSAARDRQVELKQALDALAHANRQLELSNERIAIMRRIAEEAQRTKSMFVSNVSHEFRTPLNIIIGLAEILSAGADVYGQELPEGAQHDIQILFRNTEHLSRMVNDVLDLSQVEAGKLAMMREWVDLRVLIDSALTTMPPLLDRKHLYLEKSIDPDLPAIFCDTVRIRQVLMNLVSNATRHTETGGITVRAERRGERAVISVQDTGEGIPFDLQQRVFEPFQQALNGRARDGSGLGLSISRELVEMHQGHMWLESTPGEGSTFYFSLPLQAPPGHVAPPGRWITEGWEARDQSLAQTRDHKPRVLVMEQGDELYPLWERYADAECDRAQNLSEVLALQAVEPAQVILVNTHDAQAIGLEVMAVSDALPDVPVIGYSVAPRSEQTLNLDVLEYLLKPIHSADLNNALLMVPDLRRLLIVDDDEDTLWVLRRYVSALAGEAVAVQTAGDGATALQLMQSWAPDLVLLDVVLPEMNGWQVLEAKRSMASISHIPVVMVSAQNLVDTPVSSRMVVATMGAGISWGQMLRAMRSLSEMLVKPN